MDLMCAIGGGKMGMDRWMGYLNLNRLTEADFKAPFAAFGELVGRDGFTLL